MTIAEIIRNGKGKTHGWRVVRTDHLDGAYVATLWHYSTPMLQWYRRGSQIELNILGTGHGSVSDQNGMNIAFRELDAPYYYSRQNGANIRNTETGEVIA